jgi:hypothetical protein
MNPKGVIDNNETPQDGAENPGKGKEQKPSLTQRIHSGWHEFRSTTGGRWCVRIGKGLAGGAALFGAYNLGKKSVKPVTVYVTPMASEDKTEEPVDETPTERAEEEITEE